MTALNRTHWIGFLLVLAFALTSPAHGQVFRCKDATGKLSFSDRPCDSGQSGALVQRQRSQEAIQQERMQAAEAQFQKEVRRSMEAPQIDQAPMRPTAPVSPTVNQWACRKAKDNYQTTAGGTFRNALEKAKTLQEEEQRVNKACGTNQNEYANPQAIADQDRQQKAARRAVIERSMPEDVPIYKEINRCSGQYCYDNAGQSYHSIGNGQIRSNDGTTCTMSAGKYRCQ